MSEADQLGNMSASEPMEDSPGDAPGKEAGVGRRVKESRAKAGPMKASGVPMKKSANRGRIANAGRKKKAKRGAARKSKAADRNAETVKGRAKAAKADDDESESASEARKMPRKGRGAKRHGRKAEAGVRRTKAAGTRMRSKDVLSSITRNDIRRLAYRAGIQRLSAKVTREVQQALKAYLKGILPNVLSNAAESKRRTIYLEDVTDAIAAAAKA